MQSPRSPACIFCQHPLDASLQCINIRCSSHQFAVGNFVRSIGNFQSAIGRVTKVYKEPSSKGQRDVIEVQFAGFNYQLMYSGELSHDVFSLGTQVMTEYAGLVTIDSEPQVEKGLLQYRAINDAGQTIYVPETQILNAIKPIPQMLQEKEFSSIERFQLRTWAKYLECAYSSTDLKCIPNSRLELLPHQVFVAHRLISSFRPRFILADEVGLGKTIEAGIVIKELLARELIRRILIIVPAQLVFQWQWEMQNKFNLRFDIFDAAQVHKLHREHPEENPWLLSNQIICSLQYARKEKVASDITELFWDVVIFDEAHHLRRYLGTSGYPRPTLSYMLADRLQERCNIILLLTATPIQLNPYELYSLIRLIDIAHFRNYEEFEEFRKHLPLINMLIKNVMNFQDLSKFEEDATIREVQDFIFEKKGKKISPEKLRNVILHEPSQQKKILTALAQEHTLSNIMIRNKKRNVILESGPRIRRVPHIIEVKQTEQEQEVYGSIRAFLAKTYNKAISEKNQGLGFVVVVLQKLLSSSKAALISTLQKRINGLREFQEKLEIAKAEKKHREKLSPDLIPDAEDEADFVDAVEVEDEIITKAAKFEFEQIPVLEDFVTQLQKLPEDSKLRMLKKLTKKVLQDPGEKILIFTQFRKTLEVIEQALTPQYTVVTFYGGLTAEEKATRVELFREKGQVMVSTEVGGEGRNFQFCHILFNFDLPWNPMKLEQRIGRLDRFGQKKNVEIYNFYIQDTVESNILQVLADRIQIFEETIGGLEPILGEVTKTIKDILLTEDETGSYQKIREFNEEIVQRLEQAKEIEIKMADFLLDKRSFQMNKVGELMACYVEVTNDEVQDFFEHFTQFYFNKNILNKDQEGFLSLTLPPENLPDFPSVKGIQEFHGTFNLEIAKSKEELDFFALGHPLLMDALNYCKRPEFGGLTTAITIPRKQITSRQDSASLKTGILWNFFIEFTGVIFEREICPVFVDIENIGNLALGEFLFQVIRRKHSSLQPTSPLELSKIGNNPLHESEIVAKQQVTLHIADRLPTLELRNKNAFQQEHRKYERLKEYTFDNLKKEMDKARLEREVAYARRPSDRQWREVDALPDSQEKEKKITEMKTREKRIEDAVNHAKFLENLYEKKEFDYDEQLQRLANYKHMQVKIELYSACFISFSE